MHCQDAVEYGTPPDTPEMLPLEKHPISNKHVQPPNLGGYPGMLEVCPN